MRFSLFRQLTQLSHSFFGLPFIGVGALLPFVLENSFWNLALQRALWRGWLWIVPAFFAARISGMAFNQWIDWKIDAKNPRTAERVIASGRVKPRQGAAVALSSLLLFILICYQINSLCAFCAAPIALLIYLYSYMKRWHVCCHYVLGIIYFCAPTMATLAVSGRFLPESLFLGASAGLLISGSDIIYALQDLEFDRQEGLKSLPALYGEERSMHIALLSHLLSVGALFALGLVSELKILTYGTLVILSMLGVMHFFLRREWANKSLVMRVFRGCNTLTALALLLLMLFECFF